MKRSLDSMCVVVGQFGTKQFGTGQFGTIQFGTQIVKTDDLAPRRQTVNLAPR